MATTAYLLRRHLNRAVRELRDAEDLARTEMPAWPTADRIRDIYEQIGEDLLAGKTSVPPLLERLRTAEAERDALKALCGCSRTCGDDGDIDGPGTCKGLPCATGGKARS